LEKAKQQTGIAAAFAEYEKVIAHDGVDAVVIATPNFTHAPIALAEAVSQAQIDALGNWRESAQFDARERDVLA
jgi:predicted dehydrogenase